MKSVFNSLILSTLVSESQVNGYWGFGWCPLFQTYGNIENFDPVQYSGNWYVVKKDKDGQYDANLDCVTATYEYEPAWYKFYPLNVLNRAYDREADTIGDPLIWGSIN